ncbi:prohibitin family protein [Pokkaliibacter sp. MBI-7]|uniref:prohibitin family protein n=1 Tax=Pokkaliibacter sp. MBI-7 TaxID=3040600 RepID=UPI002448B984|nr:prohibitin family protein [Pokkaliibacter sp. MBI-7]MDH2434871.1 prohibitin family protein [Pokkaliibacter sp. MBI-7]
MTETNLSQQQSSQTGGSRWQRFSAWREERALRIGKWLKRHSMPIYISMLMFVLSLIILAPNIFINVPAGHAGVLWLRFFGGTVTDHYYGEGLHMIFPWDEMYIYDTRLQNSARVYDTISSNGLSMQVEIAVRYRVNKDALGMLHKLVGPDYPEILVYPEIGSHARELISRYTPEQLYTETRAFIQAQILQRMVTQLGNSLINQSSHGRLVNVEDVLIRSVKLPDKVAQAIERKAEQYQAMLEYDFRIAREKKERDRKIIEAEGIRAFQDIVAKTITPEYLRLRGIDATMALATSQNSKMIIIGGKDGLPVILNTGDVAPSSAAATSDNTGLSPSLDITSPNAKMQDVTPPNAAIPSANTSPGAGKSPAAAPLTGASTNGFPSSAEMRGRLFSTDAVTDQQSVLPEGSGTPVTHEQAAVVDGLAAQQSAGAAMMLQQAARQQQMSGQQAMQQQLLRQAQQTSGQPAMAK